MSGTKWKERREQLKMIMKKEVSLMREVLANMHQEEYELLGDGRNWQSLMKERAHLLERLGDLKTARQETREQLKELLPFSKKELPIEQFLALDDEGYSEILLLQDQFSALLERTQFQNQRNTSLQQKKRQLAINSDSSYNPVVKLYNKKKQNSVTTCETYDHAE